MSLIVLWSSCVTVNQEDRVQTQVNPEIHLKNLTSSVSANIELSINEFADIMKKHFPQIPV